MTATVTVLGLGPMGQALTTALLDAGYRTTVWNRTAAKADNVLARGARWATTPADAIAAGDLILVNVVDQTVVDAVLGAAGEAVHGATIVGLASDTPDTARATAELVESLGGRYLDGAIMTPTDTIGKSGASILFSGSQEIFDEYREVFGALATTSYLGADHGRAAGYDMALLDLFWTSVSGFQHAVTVAQANGISPAELLPHANGIVGILTPIFTEIAERIDGDRHDQASAPVSSVAASVRHLIATSQAAGVDADALESFRRYVDAAVANGYGDDEISRIATTMRI